MTTAILEIQDRTDAIVVVEGTKIHASFSYVKYSPQSRVRAWGKAEGFKLGMLYALQNQAIIS